MTDWEELTCQAERDYDFMREEELLMSQWQPIETAPKDGTEILLYNEEGNIESGNWVEAEPDGTDCMGSDAGWMSFSGLTFPGRSFGNPDYFTKQQAPPTHWMPLPEPPETES